MVRTTRVAVLLRDEVLAALNQRAVATGRSRSQIIREAIERHLKEEVDAEIDRAIIEGYKLIPPEPDPWADVAAKRSIAEEPWR